VTRLYSLAAPLLASLDPERAHRLTIRALQAGLASAGGYTDDPILQLDVWGLTFRNPVGIAAGFDKHAEAVRPMIGLGLGLVEIGSVTPQPQPGNPRPRVFRLRQDEAVINRYGFNSEGMTRVAARLARLRNSGQPALTAPLGVNLGKNKTSDDAAADYCMGVETLGPYADYLVINVSSPNTPGLRALQSRESLQKLIEAVQAARRRLASQPPLLLKVAPDLTEQDKADIAEVALATELSGLIVSNTTIERPPGLRSENKDQTGGLSGRPLFAPSTKVLADFYHLTAGKLPLVGVGGIFSAADAYAKIRAGASLVQLYTGLVYQGPKLIAEIKEGLADFLRRDGYASLSEAIGADHRR
jgi:dihydroorotate dehydrogenase